MKRQFESYLIEWKDRKSRKPLIIRGARQIGKTYTVEEFGKKYFKDIIKINFEERAEYHDFFQSFDAEEILLSISSYFSKNPSDGKTLIFFDEIQHCPKAITALRYLHESKKNLYVIAAGSLLDHVLNDIKYSMPVGRVEFAYMHPLNFYEFLEALGETALVSFLEKYDLRKKINIPVHNKLLRLVRTYYFIGGMPEAVKEYSENKDLTAVERIHESILRSLEFDFSKYGTKVQQEVLMKVLRYVPTGIGKKIKFVNIDPDRRSEQIKTALHLLEMSRIVHLVKHTKASGIPLEQGVSSRVMKPLLLDIGLANHVLKLRLNDVDDLITANEGSLAEQFIGQQLLTTEPFYIDPQLYYWNREAKNSNAELDFVTESGRQILPVEVKAGKTGRLKSLQIYMKEKKLKTAVRFNADLPSVTETGFKLISLPLYLALEFKRIVCDG